VAGSLRGDRLTRRLSLHLGRRLRLVLRRSRVAHALYCRRWFGVRWRRRRGAVGIGGLGSLVGILGGQSRGLWIGRRSADAIVRERLVPLLYLGDQGASLRSAQQ